MSQTITGAISTGVTLTNQDTTISKTALLTTATGVAVALTGSLNNSTATTVTNFGTIIGSNFEAVVLQNNDGDLAVAGTIHNESGGLIDGSGGYGVLVYGPGVVDNDAGGTITGAVYAIGLQGDPSSVTNAGLIQSSDVAILEIGTGGGGTLAVVNQAGGTITGADYGIYLESGAHESVVNQAGATINGAVDLDAAGTVTNAGAIMGTNGVAVTFGSAIAPVRLIVDPGAVFGGAIAAVASNPSTTIELATGSGAAGTLDGFGSTITNFNTLVFDTGAKWAISSNRAGLNHVAAIGFAHGDTIDLTNVATADVSINYVANNATVTIVGGDSFTVAGAFADLSAQGDGAGGTLLVVAPIITADTANPAAGDYAAGKVISFTLTTSEAATVAGAPTLTLNDGGVASYVSGSGTTSLVFSTTVAAGQNAAALAVTGVVLPAGASITDGAGAVAVPTGAIATFTGLQIDTAAPTITADTASPATGDDTTGKAISFTLATSEAVSVVGAPTLTLNDGGTATYNAAASTSTSLVFSATVAAGQNAAALAVTGVVLPAGSRITDGAGNAAVLTGANATFAGLQVDTSAPTITGDMANPGAGDYPTGTVITFTLATSESVTVAGAPTLTLNDGGTATYNAAASTSTSLVFTTTVAAGQNAAALAVTGAPLTAGASITDGAGNAAVLTGAAATFTGLQIDTTAPVVSSPALSVAENSAATPIGIAAPTDAGATTSQLTITAGVLPTDGTVTLADGNAVSAGMALTSTQLAGLLFTPTQGEFGQSSSFTYSVADPANNASTGSATLAIGPAVGNPVVSSPSVTVAENGPATALGIAAPTDPNYMTSELTIVAGALPTDGTVLLADGVTAVMAGQALTSAQLAGLVFIPTAGQFGQSSTFTYSVTDPASNASTGAATLAIGPALGNPVVAPASVTVAENGPATAIGITAPTDPNYAAAQLIITAGALPTDGTVLLADGVTAVTAGMTLSSAQLTGLLFTPTTGQFGRSSSFTYFVTDPANNASTGAATLAIGPALGDPTASSPSATVDENGPATAIGIAAPTDPNYTTAQLTITAGAQPADGVVTLANGTAVAAGMALTSTQLTGLLFTPTYGEFGQSSTFTYSVADPANNASTGAATLAIGPALGNPIVVPASVVVAENGPAKAIGIAAPTDPNYTTAQLAITAGALPTDGVVTLADGSAVAVGMTLTSTQLTGLLFTPTAGKFGASSIFTYAVTDPANNASTGTATLGIGPAIGNPAVSSPSATVAENAATTPVGIAAPTDPNYAAAQLTITAGALPTDGIVSLSNGAAVSAGQVLTSAQLTTLQFTPTAGKFGQSSAFTYSVADPANNAGAGTATLAIGPAVGSPVTTPGTLTVAPGQAATALNAPAPSDPNYAAAQLTATVAALPTDGTIDLADGVTPVALNQALSVAQLTSLTFVVAAGVASTQSTFGYTVADPALNTARGSFTLAVGANSVVATPSLAPGNLITDTTMPTLTGIAAPGSLVTLQLNNAAIGTATANATTGAFAVAPANPLPLGADTLTVTASTATGISAASAPTKLFVLPNPVNGIVAADTSTVDLASVLGQGFQLQFTAGTEALQLLDGTLSVGPDTNEAYLARLYGGLLHSNPNGAGYADDLLAGGTSTTQVATDFLATPQAQGQFAGLTNAAFVATIGQDLLGRTFSAGDAASFTGLLSAGTSRGAVLAGIANSAEAKTALGALTGDVFVPRPAAAGVYQLFETGLARESDLASAQFATNEVLQGGLSLLQVAQQISNTTEFLADHAGQANTAYVNSLYQSGLGRPVDAAGSALLTGALTNGQISRGDALFAVASSSEAAARLTHSLF